MGESGGSGPESATELFGSQQDWGAEMPVTIDVPPRRVRSSDTIGTERNRSFEEMKGYDNYQNTGGVDPEDRHQVGALGELAFSIHADLRINAKQKQWSDGGVDFEAYIAGVEQTIDIKTRQKDPDVFAVKEESISADLYVLGHLVGDSSVEFLGMATRERVLNGNRKLSPKINKYNRILSLSSLDPIPDSEAIESSS